MAKELTQAEKAKAALKIANDAKAKANTPTTTEPTEAEKAKAKADADGKKAEEKAKADAEAKAKADAKKKEGFINPLDAGVTYEEFVASIPKGKSVETHLKGKMTKDELNWIVEEINHYKNNKKK